MSVRTFVPGRRLRPLVLLLALAFAAGPAFARAQAPADSTAMPAPDPETEFPYTLDLWETVQRMVPGQSIRIAHDQPGVVQGYYTGHDDWDLTLEGYGLETTVPLEAIDEVYFERSHHLRSALIGGALGLVAALGIAALIRSAEADGEGSNTGGVIAVSLGIGIPLGFGLGALFGGSETSWERVYPGD